MKNAVKSIRRAMDNARSYDEWRSAALEYDRLFGFDDWKEDDASPYYDYPLIRYRYNDLRSARQRGDVNQLVFSLQEGLHGNLGNIANPKLYTHAAFGTKTLVTQYIDEVCRSLEYLCNEEFEHFSFTKKLEFFKTTGQAFGRSAMMLSGGAALGLFHLGVCKALWDEKLLPRVMSGSSAGSIIVAAIGTHTEDELGGILEPSNLYTQAFKLVGWRSIFKGRPLLDGEHLDECLKRNVPEITFEEAFQRSGRLINITVSPYDTHQESRLLNARTSPSVLVRTASLASSAIPGVFPPVMLMAKNVRGELVPYIPSRKWVDGSIKNDLPLHRLARLYGVNHTIVSQTNPHVLPFLAGNESQFELIRGFREVVTKNLSLNAYLSLDFLRRNVPNNDLALLLDKAQSVVSQRYAGDINIVPPRVSGSLFRLTKNPTKDELQNFIELGEQCTWPKIELIRTTTAISRTFEVCIQKLRTQEMRQLKNPKLLMGDMPKEGRS